MTKQNALQIFENRRVRSAWDAEAEKWYISIVDTIEVLTDSIDPRKYWNKLKQRLKEEGSELVTICHQLKMLAADGKMRMTDVAGEWPGPHVRNWRRKQVKELSAA